MGEMCVDDVRMTNEIVFVVFGFIFFSFFFWFPFCKKK